MFIDLKTCQQEFDEGLYLVDGKFLPRRAFKLSLNGTN